MDEMEFSYKRAISRLTAERDEWKSERDRIRSYLSDAGRDTIDSEQSWKRRAIASEAERDRLRKALEGMLAEWDRLTRYGSPMAKAANERVAIARAALSTPTESDAQSRGAE